MRKKTPKPKVQQEPTKIEVADVGKPNFTRIIKLLQEIADEREAKKKNDQLSVSGEDNPNEKPLTPPSQKEEYSPYRYFKPVQGKPQQLPDMQEVDEILDRAKTMLEATSDDPSLRHSIAALEAAHYYLSIAFQGMIAESRGFAPPNPNDIDPDDISF